MSVRILLLAVLVLGACTDDSEPVTPLGGALRLTGSVVDFKTGALVDGDASISTSGLIPAPEVTTRGSSFALDGVPENSVFHVLAEVPPTHHATYGPAVAVTTTNRSDLEAIVVSEDYLAQLGTTFGVTPSTARGVLIVQLVDEAMQGRAGVPASSLSIEAGADVQGPFFLDADANPAATLTSTSESGWAVYFEVALGVVGLKAQATAPLTVDMPISPVSAGAITVVRARVTDGGFVAPTNVSFTNQVFPIFRARGCVACHEAGNGPGRDLGNLTLNTDTNLVFRELTIEDPTRVVVAMPDTSLLLTRPLREDPPDVHPNITFASTLDPDYQLIRAWIAEGAKQN